MDEQTQDDEEPKEGHLGGDADALAGVEMPNAGAYVKASVFGGVIAGFIYLTYLVLLHSGADVTRPLRALASLFLAEDALSKTAPLNAVVLVGLLDHALVSLFWGLVFGLVLACSRYGWSPGTVVTMGVLFGAVIWLIDFYIFAPVFWPWLLDMSSFSEFVGHVFFFGLPLSAWVVARTRY